MCGAFYKDFIDFCVYFGFFKIPISQFVSFCVHLNPIDTHKTPIPCHRMHCLLNRELVSVCGMFVGVCGRVWVCVVCVGVWVCLYV